MRDSGGVDQIVEDGAAGLLTRRYRSWGGSAQPERHQQNTRRKDCKRQEYLDAEVRIAWYVYTTHAIEFFPEVPTGSNLLLQALSVFSV